MRTSYDFPPHLSNPVQFNYEQTASLSGGLYTFTLGRNSFTPARPIIPHTLYLVNAVTFALDVDEADYLTALAGADATKLQFSLYMDSMGGSPLLREPLQLPTYFVQFAYQFAVMPTRKSFFKAGIEGVLQEHAGILGKSSLTAKIILSAVAISDRDFIRRYRQGR